MCSAGGTPGTWLGTTDLADAFIQSNLQMRTIEAIKIKKRTII